MAVITGTEGYDLLTDSSDNDQISALGGDDLIAIYYGGFDTVDGGTGRDRLWFRMEVAFAYGGREDFVFTSTPNGGSISGNATWAAGSTITSFVNVEDVTVSWLIGDYNDSITTGAGDDIIDGQGGLDDVHLGAGFDTITYNFLGDASGNGQVTMTVQSQDADGYNGVITGPVGGLDFTGVDVFNIYAVPGNATLSGGRNNDRLRSGGGTNLLNGNGGDDTLLEDFGANSILNGGDGNDSLSTNGSGSVLNGDEGNDSLTVAGSGTAHGGAGTDRLTISVGGQVTMSAPSSDPLGGYQGSIGTVNYTGIESFSITTGSAADTITTGDGDDAITSREGNDTIHAAGGNDTIDGGSGNNIIYGGDGDDSITTQGGSQVIDGGAGNDSILLGGNGSANVTGGTGNDTLITTEGADTINGGDGDDVINGLGGNDVIDAGEGNDDIDGGAGNDQLTGGSGNDTFRMSSAADTIIEAAGGGTDLIVTGLRGFSMAAFANVENLTTTSTLGVRYTGNSGDNVITGSSGDDALIGLAGADTLVGGAGNDGYILEDGLDTIVEAVGGGNDSVYTTASYALSSGAEVEALSVYERTTTDALNLTGNGFGQAIYGNNGVNFLNGNGGADVLYGLAGDDAYLVDWLDDTVLEAVGGGTDTVYAAGSFTLTSGAEAEVLSVYERTTTGALNLTGNEFGQAIYGNDGINFLNGNGGADVLYGLGGDDAYLVDWFDDTVLEAAGGGTDTVYAAGSFALTTGAEVETLSVYERSTTGALDLTGNEVGQAIYGNNGVNFLNGNGGADVLYGLGGDDSYLVDWLDDAVLEVAGGGSDTVYAVGNFALTSGAEVEVLSVYDRATTEAINLNGNEFGQAIYGNAGTNIIDGKGGSDTIYLMGGSDTVSFTTPLGAGNVDAVVGFASGDDKLMLDSVTFAGLAAGVLPASAFAIGPAAGEADDRIVYEQASGQLWFDADGNGTSAAVLFATLEPGTALAASDFVVV